MVSLNNSHANAVKDHSNIYYSVIKNSIAPRVHTQLYTDFLTSFESTEDKKAPAPVSLLRACVSNVA